jgi:hypothetical protein
LDQQQRRAARRTKATRVTKVREKIVVAVMTRP